MNSSLINKYNRLYNNVLNNNVIDPSSYMEFYTYKLLSENNSISVKNNFKIKDGLPVSHAPPGPDIEVFINNTAFICECTLKTGIKQFDDEHESVSRHYEDFYNKYFKQYKNIFCFFISQKISNEIIEWYYTLYPDIIIIPIKTVDFIFLMNKIKSLNEIEYEKEIISISKLIDSSSNAIEWVTKLENQF